MVSAEAIHGGAITGKMQKKRLVALTSR